VFRSQPKKISLQAAMSQGLGSGLQPKSRCIPFFQNLIPINGIRSKGYSCFFVELLLDFDFGALAF